MKLKICDRCNDTQLDDNGLCPVCSQQILYFWSYFSVSYPLSIIQKGLFHTRRQSGRSAGPVGKFRTCAVIDVSTKDEYLTACGNIVEKNCSVWMEAPNCAKCRKELRKNIK